MTNYVTATKEDVLKWITEGLIKVFVNQEGKATIAKGNRELTQRIHTRRGMEDGDLRVDVRHRNKRRSITVSHLVWMDDNRRIIPNGFEIHHVDENRHNNHPDNLCCVYGKDHFKLHIDTSEEDEIPF